MSAPPNGPIVLHASAVAFENRGLLILGPSGSGKSSLAIELMALGATLIADDGVVLTPQDGALKISAPNQTAGMVEARGIGLLKADAGTAWARAVVDLAQVETERLPRSRQTVIADVALPLIHRVETSAFASMLKVLMLGGRLDV